MKQQQILPVARREGLEYTPVEDGCLVYDADAECVHFLNLTAFFVLQSCDGQTGRDAMAQSLQKAFDLTEPPRTEIDNCLSTLRNAGLLQEPSA